MKAIVKSQAGKGLEMQEVPTRKPDKHEVLIKIHQTSICGTDLNIYKWDPWAAKTVPFGATIGHEFVGHVVEVGSDVTEVKVGDRVSGEGHVTCGTCRSCRTGNRHLCPETKIIGIHEKGTGCFAEYLTLPAENAFLVPDSISDDIASIFDPFGNAVHTTLCYDLVGKDVLITGAGPIGLMAIPIALHAGARRVVITDVSPYRLNLAKKMGATRVVDVSKESVADVAKELSAEFSVGLEMSGNPQAFQTLIETLVPGGQIALLGILPPNTVIDWDTVIFRMLQIKGICGREIFNTWYTMCDLIAGGVDVEPVITHRFPAEEFQKGFDAMLSGESGRVILTWEG